ncbi:MULTISPECIES: DUF2935 domain-containing protein [Paenibacillus]|uniref:Uncharacterized protein n=1 Tax=Paenibacillus odorifer TaxID=189426 RepID=A0A1R0WU61_9BACL|nr:MULTISPECIES: DUF2935 domain-containing protein [Paenibacillus]AIQ74358.1 hypothetical protein PODO_14455 [Paenibacillus odorifer]ETT65986.1 hypothetical protein C171_05872 [Paenibacillus sp. FSL H8-237]MEC0133492.1 DUF2935 domain-containing protein [Paenibacillus odorifer]MEC0224811.1 DUF2935 domain-containing protein [Paenibacillus odorifer]OMC96620.1 hypothetical protein BJP46_04865 [Paenibacillus odorifer]
MPDPFVSRSLDEIRFWSRIMKEHSFFLKLGFRCEDTQLINEANHFYATFEAIENRSLGFTVDSDPAVIRKFNEEVHSAASHIWAFKRKILGLILQCKLPGGTNFPLLVDHVSREANYFRNRLEELNQGRLDPLPDAIINENVFFLRIMADHAKFIGHLLDPSERQLVEQARNFSHDFDVLLYQAIDLSSMRPQSQTKPLLSQQLDENKVSVKSLRDFKKTARDLIEECRIKSIIHPLLADHVFREAERFLYIIDAFEASLNMNKQIV